MRPGVGGKLVALSVGTLDRGCVLGSGVDLALVDVVASDEEGGLSVVGLEYVQNVVGVLLLWAIVVSDGYRARGRALVDTSTSVLNISDLRTGNGGSVVSGRSLVLGASRTELVLATGGVAVVLVIVSIYSYLSYWILRTYASVTAPS